MNALVHRGIVGVVHLETGKLFPLPSKRVPQTLQTCFAASESHQKSFVPTCRRYVPIRPVTRFENREVNI